MHPGHSGDLPARRWTGDIRFLALDCPDELRRDRINALPGGAVTLTSRSSWGPLAAPQHLRPRRLEQRGIGHAVAAGLGRAGMTVFLCARGPDAAHDAAATLRTDGLDVRAVQLDVIDSSSIERAAAHVQRDAGRLDVLVNNAGIAGERGPQTPGTAELDAIRAVFETNVFGVIAVTEAMLPLLRQSQRGRIVNVSSSVGSLSLMSDPDHYFATLPGWLGYPVSKTALNQITVQYAKQLRPEGILVNAADPGPIATSLTARARGITRTPADGARIVIELATTESDQTGSYRRQTGPVPW